MRIIDIPNEALLGARHCYNPSIIEHNDEIYMFYRYLIGRYETDIALCQLDHTFKVIPNSNRKLKLTRMVSSNATVDDPRAFHIGKDLYLMTCQGHLLNADWSWTTSIVFNKIFQLQNNTPHLGQNIVVNFGKNINKASKVNTKGAAEKNWTPFSGFGGLRFLYTINPLVVVDYDSKEDQAKEISRTEVNLDFWKWGDFLAGSTPLIRYKGEWLGFFHSYLNEQDFNRRRYFVGAFTINEHPPYKITRISREPIMRAEMDYDHDLRWAEQGWLPNVVFPCGLIKRDDRFYMSYGWQDCRCKIAEIEEEELNKNLKEIKEWQPQLV